MFYVLQLIAVGVLALVAVNVWNAWRGGRAQVEDRHKPGVSGPAAGDTPVGRAVAALSGFEDAQAELKAAYPIVFAMLGGYLNAHTVGEHGGPEGAVKEMVADWAPRRDEASRELTRLLADAPEERDARAVVLAACDADFDREGYRAWLVWLLGQFNRPSDEP